MTRGEESGSAGPLKTAKDDRGCFFLLATSFPEAETCFEKCIVERDDSPTQF